MIDERQRAAQERMSLRGPDESRMAQEGQQNAGGMQRRYENGEVYYDPAPLTEYPRMLYRKTDKEQTQEWADAIADLKDPPMVINRFDGLLCDTMIVNSKDEAERATAEGWDISPRAAHGLSDGLAKEVTSKDDEIARLRAELAARDEMAGVEPLRRGPGRPPKNPELTG